VVEIRRGGLGLLPDGKKMMIRRPGVSPAMRE
jgi:hypothetical protein